MLVAALGLLLMGVPLSNSVAADLNSPIYAVREKARDTLRASFASSDHAKWDALVADLQRHQGDSPSDAASLCQQAGVTLPQFPGEAPPYFIARSRLDSCWMLECRFRDGKLGEAKLVSRAPILRLSPPGNFTGLWRTYRENGDLVDQIYYSKGKAIGPLVDSPVLPAAPISPGAPVPDVPPPVIEYAPAK